MTEAEMFNLVLDRLIKSEVKADADLVAGLRREISILSTTVQQKDRAMMNYANEMRQLNSKLSRVNGAGVNLLNAARKVKNPSEKLREVIELATKEMDEIPF